MLQCRSEVAALISQLADLLVTATIRHQNTRFTCFAFERNTRGLE